MPDINRRLNEIAAYSEGWFDGNGKAFREDHIEIARRVLISICEGFDLPHPHIYPTAENQLCCEWSFGESGEQDTKLSFNFSQLTLEATALNLQTDVEEQSAWELSPDTLTKSVQQAGRFVRTQYNGTSQQTAT